ncbi:hypothetical protein LguiA_035052 [Lonicera macranthoides]
MPYSSQFCFESICITYVPTKAFNPFFLVRLNKASKTASVILQNAATSENPDRTPVVLMRGMCISHVMF